MLLWKLLGTIPGLHKYKMSGHGNTLICQNIPLNKFIYKLYQALSGMRTLHEDSLQKGQGGGPR